LSDAQQNIRPRFRRFSRSRKTQAHQNHEQHGTAPQKFSPEHAQNNEAIVREAQYEFQTAGSWAEKKINKSRTDPVLRSSEHKTFVAKLAARRVAKVKN